MKRTLSLILLGTVATLSLLFISYFIVYAIMSITPQENTTRVHDTVKAVCDEANSLRTGDAWKACYTAQDASRTEYLCNNSHCWIEEQ